MFGNLEEFVAATVDAYKLGKEAGGNASASTRVPTKTPSSEFDAIWVKHLKAALMDNRFLLAQLPIAGLRSDSVQMYDLLVRMVDEQGNVGPAVRVPAGRRAQ